MAKPESPHNFWSANHQTPTDDAGGQAEMLADIPETFKKDAGRASTLKEDRGRKTPNTVTLALMPSLLLRCYPSFAVAESGAAA